MLRSGPRLLRVAYLLLTFLPVVTHAPGVTATTPVADATATPVAPGTGDRDPVLYEAVLPDQRAGVIAATAGHLSRYRIDATLHGPGQDVPSTITGQEDLLFVNGTGKTLTDLYFRLYPNAEIYAEGGIAVQDVTVDDQRVTPRLRVGDTVLQIPLPEAIASGDTADVHLAFTTTIPFEPSRGYGMFAYVRGTGTWSLAQWYPILAGYDPVSRWLLVPPSTVGDPVFSTTALYDVSFTTERTLTVVTSGRELTSEDQRDQTRRRFVTGPARDLTIVVDDNVASVSQDVGGTRVTSYFDPSQAKAGREVLKQATQALSLYSDLFGTYPYAELDLVEMKLRSAGGIEFPQLIYIEDDYYSDRSAARTVPDGIGFVVAHEVGHQWWYGLVGNNQYAHAFIDEGLTNYLTTVYFEKVYGAAVGKQQVNLELKASYFAMLFTGGDKIVDQPTDNFGSDASYGPTVYGKGGLGFGAVRAAIGDEAFFGGLRAYAARFRFGIAAPADLRSAFEGASGQDLGKLWHHWFDAAEGRQDYSVADAAELRRELGNNGG